MVVSLLVAFSAPLFVVGLASAQVNAPNCSDSSRNWDWSLNSLGQGPCKVAAYLASACNNGSFTIPTLLSQHSYTGPGGSDNNDTCKCNTVVYNLVSACDACQGQSWIPYSQWTANCTAVAAPRTFPEPVPAGTRVPQWAYLDPTADNNWNLTAAQFAGVWPEVTGSITIVSASTVTFQTPSSVSSSSLNLPYKGNSNAGEIVGGVVGGIIGAALIVGIILWFIIRSRRARTQAASAEYIYSQSDMWQAMGPYSKINERPRTYDPSDPSTYPMWTLSLMMGTKNCRGQPHGSETKLKYSGLPEV